jgi:hypothetical protein
MDCFAEFIIGRAFRATRWLAMTGLIPFNQQTSYFKGD